MKTSYLCLSIGRTCPNMVGYKSRKDHIRGKDWGCSRILYHSTTQKLGSTLWSLEKLSLPTSLPTIFIYHMAPTLPTPYTRSEIIHSKLRLVTDYQALKKDTVKNHYPLPWIEELLELLSIFIVSLFWIFLRFLVLCINYLIFIPPLFELMKLPTTLFISRRHYDHLQFFIFQTSLNYLSLSQMPHNMQLVLHLNMEATSLLIT